MKALLPESNEPQVLRAWANSMMLYASAEFYDSATFARNTARSASKERFWEMDSQDIGANRAASGSTSFWVEWACYLASTRGVDALHYALGIQDIMAARFAAMMPRVQEAAHRIAVLQKPTTD